MNNSKYGLLISLFLVNMLFITLIFFISLDNAKKHEIEHLKLQNESIISNQVKQESEINQLQLSINKLLNEDSILDHENPAISHKPIISMNDFKLFSPSIKEKINSDEGFTLRAEINKNAVNSIKINILDSTRRILRTIEINDEFFDDGVSLEWTPFFLKVTFDIKPTTEKGIFQIEDIHNNEVIDFPIYFII